MTKTSLSIPKHIAIIMDGNRRWAKQHKLKALQGHQYVTDKVIEPLLDACVERGVEYLTLWAFSTENWQRDKTEVEGLMKIFRSAFSKSAQDLYKKGVRLNYIGDMSKFPTDIQEGVKKWMDISKNNTKITATFALNYGGQDEIIRAIHKLKAMNIDPQTLTVDQFSSLLDTAKLPNPDLLIRPGGEQRLSGFMPWQTVYTELYFTDVLMPDFDQSELQKAIEEYQSRSRRFGR